MKTFFAFISKLNSLFLFGILVSVLSCLWLCGFGQASRINKGVGQASTIHEKM